MLVRNFYYNFFYIIFTLYYIFITTFQHQSSRLKFLSHSESFGTKMKHPTQSFTFHVWEQLNRRRGRRINRRGERNARLAITIDRYSTCMLMIAINSRAALVSSHTLRAALDTFSSSSSSFSSFSSSSSSNRERFCNLVVRAEGILIRMRLTWPRTSL